MDTYERSPLAGLLRRGAYPRSTALDNALRGGRFSLEGTGTVCGASLDESGLDSHAGRGTDETPFLHFITGSDDAIREGQRTGPLFGPSPLSAWCTS